MEGNSRWVALTALAPIAWGATYYITREYLPAGAPLWGAALRALPAGLILLIVARRLPRGRWWWRSLVLGALNFGAFFALVYIAAVELPTSTAASIMALAPLTLAGLAWPLLGERPTLRFAFGATAGVLGVLLIVGTAAGARIDEGAGLGVAASGAALVMSSAGAVLTTRWRDDTPLVASTSWQLTAGGLLLLPFAAFAEGPPPALDTTGIVALAFLSVIATAGAFVVWFGGLRHLPAGSVGVIGLLNPVTGVLLGTLLGGETLTGAQFAGIALVLAAVAVGGGRRRARSTAQRPGRASPVATSNAKPRTYSFIGISEHAVMRQLECSGGATTALRPVRGKERRKNHQPHDIHDILRAAE